MNRALINVNHLGYYDQCVFDAICKAVMSSQMYLDVNASDELAKTIFDNISIIESTTTYRVIDLQQNTPGHKTIRFINRIIN